MRVLGISAYYHDSAAVLIEDGRVVAAAQEERFSRIKHDAAFPASAVRFCLETSTDAIDAVVYYEKPLLKFERVLRTAFAAAPFGFNAFAAAIPLWMKEKLWIPLQIEKAFDKIGLDVSGKVHFSSHHLSHAASAFYPSPYSRAAFLTLDGVGEWATTAFGRGEGKELQLMNELHFPDSLGLLYSAFTYFCGFKVNSGEYKLMGLAPYGTPRFREKILSHLLELKEDGSFRLNLEYFGYLRGERMTTHAFDLLFEGPARKSDEPLSQRECDLARSIQEVTERVVLQMARTVHEVTGEKNLCLAGGVALNCVANGKLAREGPFENIWIQPAAGDAGGALGAALAYYHIEYGGKRETETSRDGMRGSLLGPAYSDDEIAAALADKGITSLKLSDEVLIAATARHLSEGAVVGFFQGRAEFGPRSLGNRSILADARSPEMQRTLNLKIKFRESFRPFAPIVLAEKAKDYFELEGDSPYMLLTVPVRKDLRFPMKESNQGGLSRVDEIRSTIPAVTHLDYSARVQTVDRETNPLLHRVLSEFDRLTGCAVLINTSFNVRGEPPVCHPREAIAGFLETGMDVLVIGSFVIEKATLDPRVLQNVAIRKFSPD